MRRFILCTLSATLAVAVGSVAHATTNNDGNATPTDRNLIAQTIDEISRERSELRRFEYRGPDITGGILSPDDRGPNNRAIPAQRVEDLSDYEAGRYQTDEMGLDMNTDQMNNNRDYPTEGTILSPDDQDPYNRAVPGPGQVDR